ncbi:DUF2167 domain-containing protein [Halomonas aestuarii]|uniref:DUF2167 domain-containing protein n=1 Tax=Halomonas aestuarii TaxID=1897729 RepID=UPI001AD81ADD|nr:DUF2167 domain-containing protein [Halomonas aestuarii]
MHKFGIILVVLTFSFSTLSHAKQENYPLSQAAIENEVANLPWETEPADYHLSKSNSSVYLPQGLALLRGDGARRFMYLSQGVEHPNIEATIINYDNLTQVTFAYQDSGYVSIDDWSEIDPDDLLEGIRKNTEKANEERIENGLPKLHVTDWLVKPVLDEKNYAAYWAILAEEGSGNVVNAVALNLGKKGFEKVTWVGTKEQYLNSDGFLETILDEHDFDQGFRYADYSTGDKVAAFGIATLVAATAGGKSKAGKTTLAAIGLAILAFMKKFFIVPIVLFFGGFWALVKKGFSSKASDHKKIGK